MEEAINVTDIYDKNLNFLIGSGASAGLFPTLALKIKNETGEPHTLESLATWFVERNDERINWLFAHYYAKCIRPAQTFVPDGADTDEKKAVLTNYQTFLGTILDILHKRKPMERRCNIFTTNYDGCFAFASDAILREGSDDFALNDGARGFHRRYLQVRNFNTYLCQTGVFERALTSVPQVNLIHLHGSIYWKKADPGILVDYNTTPDNDLISPVIAPLLETFSQKLFDPDLDVSALSIAPMAPPIRDAFWSRYAQLPIVNPTKWKFHETVFEEHYYQMLRLLSYELEKPNAILITFGFSFADEHILNLVKRSLSSDSLQVFVCCFSSNEFAALSALFKPYSNVKCITLEDAPLDFQAFNDKVFTTHPKSEPGPTVPAGA